MPKILLTLFVLILSLFILSCKDSQTTEPAGSRLTATETSVTVARNFHRYISIRGGVGPLRLKSMTDSSVVEVKSFGAIEIVNGVQWQSVLLYGTNLGSTSLTLQDSAKTTELTLVIIVSVMAAERSSITIQENLSTSVYIYGGIQPFVIDQPANEAIASVSVASGYISISAISPGNTSVIIRDSDSPAHKAAIGIAVTPTPKLITAGQLSFQSNAGNLNVNGIAGSSFIRASAGTEGAGGELQGSPMGLNECEIIAYKKKSLNIVDVMVIDFIKVKTSAGTLPVSGRSGRIDSSYVWFVINGDLSSPTADIQRLSSGSVVISSFTTERISGSFSGTGKLMKNLVVVTGTPLSVTDGSFSVPLLLEDYGGDAAENAEQRAVKQFVQRIRKRMGPVHWSNMSDE
jgi:hypothetical protein